MDIKPVRCRIPDILKQQRKSQVWLSEQIGMTKQQLGDYIHLRSIMGMTVGAKVAKALNVTLDDLYEWEWLGE